MLIVAVQAAELPPAAYFLTVEAVVFSTVVAYTPWSAHPPT